MPRPDIGEPIVLQAAAAQQWTEGQYHARLLSGGVTIRQGTTEVQARQVVAFTDQSPPPGRPRQVIVYAVGAADRPVVELTRGRDAVPDAPPVARQQSPDWFETLVTSGAVEWRSPPPAPMQDAKPEIVSRALMKVRRQDPQVTPAQFAGPIFGPPVAPPPGPMVANPQAFRDVVISKRSEVGANILIDPQPNGETVVTITEGINIVVTGINSPNLPSLLGDVNTIDLETDRAVIWTAGAFSASGAQQQNDTPLEIYMEGNIVFRQGDRIVYADRMYYDVRTRTGVVLNAELVTPLPEIDGKSYRGLVRLKAGVIRQLDESRFVASDALLTTSRLEKPSYYYSADTITFQDIQRPLLDPVTGQPAVNQATDIPINDHERLATSSGNRVVLGGVPIFYWPTIATDLEEPTFYISDFNVRNDSIFGAQVMVDLDVYQLLGAKAPDGVDWDLSLDYLSDRGFGYGTEYQYTTPDFFGIAGPARGRADLWAINDSGRDNLGRGRRNLTPEEDYRGRAFWNHRQLLADGLLEGWIAQAEVGWISDRTFLEQYYEPEWDSAKDQTTGLRLRRLFNNQSVSIEANGQINEFFTQTQWLPRLDHWILGQEAMGDSVTWFAHSSAAYADYNPATAPADPAANLGLATYTRFPWEANVKGERFVTRQELNLPIDAEPFKVVPFILGEAAHWGEALDGEPEQRTYIHTGLRASIPFWAANPLIRDPLFNLNGLAHKVVFDAELSYTDASDNFDQFPLYDELEDDSLEELRRRFYDPTFARGLTGLYNAGTGEIDPRVDPRVYAIRTGAHGWVASPVTEVVDDQVAMRLGMRHRLQTKRGAVGQERIIDWLTLDTNATWFPEEDRDNFGEPFGLLDYDLKWHLGDRFTFFSDGFSDTFSNGLRTVSGGVRLNRPTRGNVSLAYRTVRGPFRADLITAAVNYRLSPKYVASASTVLDFSEAGSIGQSFLISRLGEAVITSIGVNVDESKGNVGVNFLMEPRFLPKLNLTQRTGLDIPPAGLYGLE